MTKPTPQRHAVVYLRVSTQRQADAGVSFADGDDAGFQEAHCRALCERKGWHVLGVHSDPVSGRKIRNRPGLKAAIAAVGECRGVLVFYSVSRLSRSTRDLYNIAAQLEEKRAHLASATEDIDTTTAMGRAFFGILGVLAQLESDQTGERVKAANAHIVAKYGHRTNGQQRFGWMLDENKQLVHDPATWPLVERVLAVIAENGRTREGMCEYLNAAGVLTPKGRAWNPKRLDLFERTHC
jgi:DNA invertase Pin-like site-specific DNA recombinase